MKQRKHAKESAGAATTVATATTETTNDSMLPGSNTTRASAKSIVKISTVSHVTPEENHVAATFGTTKYSTSLPTTTFGANI